MKAHEFDTAFDNGEDVSVHVDWPRSRRVNAGTGREGPTKGNDAGTRATAGPETRYDLADRVDRITHENRHSKVDFGRSEGKEIW